MPPKKRILFLSSWLPFPANNGSRLRIYNLLRGLSQVYDIIFICLDAGATSETPPLELGSICQEVHIIPQKPFDPKSIKARLGFLSITPRSIVDTYSPEIANKICEIVSKQKIDGVIASQLGTAIYHECFKGLPAIYEEVEIGLLYGRYRQAKTFKQKIRIGLTWWKLSHYLKNLVNNFPVCTVVSRMEKDALIAIGCNHSEIEVIPNCIDISAYCSIDETPQPDTLIFTGSFNYYPNYEAMLWFLKEIYPRIKLKIPSVKLIITGDPANLPLPPTEGVIQTGFVEDVRPWVARSWISIVPILSGGGTRLKILEAMGLHTPVISTHKGAEGLAIEHNSNILMADQPDEFAESIIGLFHSPETRHRIADHAYQLVRNHYEWSVVLPQFISLVEATMENHPGGQ